MIRQAPVVAVVVAGPFVDESIRVSVPYIVAHFVSWNDSYCCYYGY